MEKVTEQDMPIYLPCEIGEVFFIVETDQAERLVGDLFRRRFNTDSFPDQPRHFVGIVKMPDNSLLTLGYVHYIMWEGGALCGGLVIDERHYRKVPLHIRKTIKRAGGVAEFLLRESFECLPDDIIAIWGRVGDKQSEKVCLRVGFEHTDADYIMSIWRSEGLSEPDRRMWVARTVALGPF